MNFFRKGFAGSLLATALVVSLLAPAVAGSHDLELAVRRLVEAAETLDIAWPWRGAVPEVPEVAKYGKSAAPLLVRQLEYGPETEAGAWNLHVEQQVALALCAVFGLEPVSGRTVYGVRSLDKEDRKVRRFWRMRVHHYLETGE
jgi:hypothetical protein